MMGKQANGHDQLFYSFNLEAHVPDHLLRGIDRFLDLSELRRHLASFYSHTGRPSIDPELMIRMLLVGYCFGIRSERRLCEEVHLNLAYRWFCRLWLEDTVPDHSSFSKKPAWSLPRERGVSARIFPDGRRIAGSDPRIHEALSRALSLPVTLARGEAPHVDSAPLHLVTTASLRWQQVDERRFRPNIVVDLPGDGPVEQRWIGRRFMLGNSAVLQIVDSTERCVMTTFAQADLPADSRVLRRLGRDAGLQFGVYAEVLAPGVVTRGDAFLEVTQ
jgi:hypothetical protein